MSQASRPPQAKIFYHDIGDYLTRDEKLAKITGFKSLAGITAVNGWQPITPDAHHDWVGQRDDSFSRFISLGSKSAVAKPLIFVDYSNGAKTNRDAWCYNASISKLTKTMESMIDFYNTEVVRYSLASSSQKIDSSIEGFLNSDNSKISWSDKLTQDVQRQKKHQFKNNALRKSLYRPFSNQWLYLDKSFNDRLGQIPRIFPVNTAKNYVISVVGLGTPKAFSALISNKVPDIQLLANGQCFPLKLYEPTTPKDNKQATFDEQETSPSVGEYTVRDGISDAGLQHFKDAYASDADMAAGSQNISKEDLFYYIYGLLHSPDYKARYADNLSKELPRIPAVKQFADFMAFSAAGRALADLHVNYETVAPYPVQYGGGAIEHAAFTDADYHVVQMKFGKGSGKSGDERHDKAESRWRASR
jgi:predicted helicase